MTDAGPINADPAVEKVDGGASELMALARRAHFTVEPIHVLVYFAPEAAELFGGLGLTGGQQYFASRSAPLGRVPSEVVTATFYNFSPRLISRAVPAAWDITTTEQVLATRLEVIDRAMHRVLGEPVLASDEMAEAAALAREAASALGPGPGRALYAAHSVLPWPDAAHLQLWHAQTLLREYRGDAHVAALVLAGLDGVEALASYLPLGRGLSESIIRATRGWNDEEWDAARARLRERGLLTDDDQHTAAGRAQREQIEEQTDRAALAACQQLGVERTERLRDLVRPWAHKANDSMFGSSK